MNHGKKPMTPKQAKKKDKETKNVSQAIQAESVNKESTHQWKILEKFPKKIAEKDAAEVNGAAKRVEIKKKKLHSKHSKRTTPGEVEMDIPPYVHHQREPESKKNLTNIENQTLAKGRRLAAKLSKSKK